MATAYARPLAGVSLTRVTGIAALVAAKAADLATTAAVVIVRPEAEANPFASPILEVAGLVGVALLSVVLVLSVILATEFAASYTADYWLFAPVAVRLFSYVPLTILWALVAARNVQQIAGVLG